MLLFILLVTVVPIVLGLAWNNLKYETNSEQLCFRYLSGLFTMFALFEVVSAPMCFLKTSFTLVCQIYSVILVAGCIISIFIFKRKYQNVQFKHIFKRPILNRWELVYLLIFLAILAYQIYKVYTMDIGWRADDDATYIAYANSAVQQDSMYLINAAKGVARKLDYVRALQGSLLFISYLSKISGISVTVMAHTILAVYLLVCAYIANFLFARRICKDTENAMIFLIVLAMLYMCGYYSEYSMSFRLLGPIWQGKAILAVVLTPFLWITLIDILQKEFNMYSGLFLVMVSTATMSMSMAGAILLAATLSVIVPIFSYIYKEPKKLLFIPIGAFVPIVIAAIYLVIRIYG